MNTQDDRLRRSAANHRHLQRANMFRPCFWDRPVPGLREASGDLHSNLLLVFPTSSMTSNVKFLLRSKKRESKRARERPREKKEVQRDTAPLLQTQHFRTGFHRGTAFRPRDDLTPCDRSRCCTWSVFVCPSACPSRASPREISALGTPRATALATAARTACLFPVLSGA